MNKVVSAMMSLSFVGFTLMGATPAAGAASVDVSEYDSRCGVQVKQKADVLWVTWTAGSGKPCRVAFSLKAGGRLIDSLEIGGKMLSRNVNPTYLISTGARVERPGVKYIFFDAPNKETHGPVRKFAAQIDLKSVRVKSSGKRVAISFDRMSAGPFSGSLVVCIYSGSPLLYIESAMGLEEKNVAYIYDAVLDGDFKTVAWKDTSDKFVKVTPEGDPRPVAVRNRTIMAETDNGTIGVVATPHAFFYPRDYSDNFKYAQVGKGRFGLRQDPGGQEGHKGAFTPWFDAPAGKTQHMGFFIYLSSENAESTLKQIGDYTHGDTLKPMDGHVILASHMHSALTVTEKTDHPHAPDFKKVFKGMNVQAYQLAEFHGDGHPQDVGIVRLEEEKGMFDLCRKYSDDTFLMIPSEEANAFVAGHSMLLFPKPVYLTLKEVPGKPLSEEISPYGTVYHPRNMKDLAAILAKEKGLGWTSHPRIKGSEGCPDRYKDTDWYKSDLWLGSTWKAMPGDLSEPRMGVRSLDLLDDMNLWGQKKTIVGEIDCFTIDSTHEIYAHMNANYLKLDKLPKPDDWSSILDVLRKGDFFVTTGEVLIHSCSAKDGKVHADLEWTFPLGQVEIVTCDGKQVKRMTIPMSETQEFGRKAFEWPVDLKGIEWFRLEVWDVAYDGAFTQPIYLK